MLHVLWVTGDWEADSSHRGQFLLLACSPYTEGQPRVAAEANSQGLLLHTFQLEIPSLPGVS